MNNLTRRLSPIDPRHKDAAMGLEFVRLLAQFAAAPSLQRGANRPVYLSSEPPNWMTIAEASAKSGLSQTLLLKLIRGGKLVSFVDGPRKVRWKDVDALTAENLIAATARKRKGDDEC